MGIAATSHSLVAAPSVLCLGLACASCVVLGFGLCPRTTTVSTIVKELLPIPPESGAQTLQLVAVQVAANPSACCSL
jgi:hypothetical protein